MGTLGLLNKITGRSYALGDAEFELRLIYERVGYAFSDENPMVVTSAGLRVASHRVEQLAGGSKRLVLRLGASNRWTRHWIGIDLYYDLLPDDFSCGNGCA